MKLINCMFLLVIFYPTFHSTICCSKHKSFSFFVFGACLCADNVFFSKAEMNFDHTHTAHWEKSNGVQSFESPGKRSVHIVFAVCVFSSVPRRTWR